MLDKENTPSSFSGSHKFCGIIIVPTQALLTDAVFERVLDAEFHYMKQDLEKYIRLYRNHAFANPDWSKDELIAKIDELTNAPF